jgi:hypothetical protein
MLKEMQEGTAEANAERKRLGYPEVQLVGWATKPHYDASTNKLYWAKELAFDGGREHALNYDIRVLGRGGYLSLQRRRRMNQLHQIEGEMQKVLALTEFDAGQRYGDSTPRPTRSQRTASPPSSPARSRPRPACSPTVRAAAGVQEVCNRRLHRVAAAVRKFLRAAAVRGARPRMTGCGASSCAQQPLERGTTHMTTNDVIPAKRGLNSGVVIHLAWIKRQDQHGFPLSRE